MRDYTLGDTFDIKFTTRGSTGAPTTLSGTPSVAAYPDNSLTEITAGITLSVDFDTRTGLNNVRVVATGANGYASGKTYALVITAGTVGGTSVVGEVVGEFTLGRSAAAVDLANGTDGLGALKAVVDAILVDTGTTLDQLVDDLEATLGLVSTAAATGDPDAATTAMGYLKQLVNILVGTAGVTTFPAEAPPGNAVSLAEVIRAIHADVTGLNGDAMRGTDSAATAAALATVDTVVDAIKAVTDLLPDAGALTSLAQAAKLQAYVQLLARSDAAIATDKATELGEINANEGTGAGDYDNTLDAEEAISDALAVTDGVADGIKAKTDSLTFTTANQVDANVKGVDDNSSVPALLADALRTMIAGTASGTPTATTMVSDVALTANDQFKGRWIIFMPDTTTVALRRQATEITGGTAATNELAFNALTTAPVSGDTFIIV